MRVLLRVGFRIAQNTFNSASVNIRERKCREKQRDWFSHSNMTFAEKFPMKERETSLEATNRKIKSLRERQKLWRNHQTFKLHICILQEMAANGLNVSFIRILFFSGQLYLKKTSTPY